MFCQAVLILVLKRNSEACKSQKDNNRNFEWVVGISFCCSIRDSGVTQVIASKVWRPRCLSTCSSRNYFGWGNFTDLVRPGSSTNLSCLCCSSMMKARWLCRANMGCGCFNGASPPIWWRYYTSCMPNSTNLHLARGTPSHWSPPMLMIFSPFIVVKFDPKCNMETC